MLNRRVVLASIVASLLPFPVHADTLVALASADRASLQTLVDRFVTAFNAKDLNAFGACFADDGEFTNPVGMYVKGRDAIVAFHERLFSPTRLPNTPSFNHAHLTLLSTSIRMVRPDVASVDIKWQQDGAIGPDGNPWGTRKGILSWIAVRNRRSWQIEVWHNMELPKIP